MRLPSAFSSGASVMIRTLSGLASLHSEADLSVLASSVTALRVEDCRVNFCRHIPDEQRIVQSSDEANRLGSRDLDAGDDRRKVADAIDDAFTTRAEFAEYQGHAAQLRTDLDVATLDIALSLSTELEGLRGLQKGVANWTLRAARAATATCAVVTSAALIVSILAGIETNIGSQFWFFAGLSEEKDPQTSLLSAQPANDAFSIYDLMGVCFLLIFVFFFATIASWLSIAHARDRELELARERGRVGEIVAMAASEAIRRSIDKSLSSEIIMRLGGPAPSLVELDSAHYTPSRSTDRVELFIRTHDASALGVAGPRGSGKTTVLRRASSQPRTLGIYIPAPVRYEGSALTERILRDVCMRVLDGTGAKAARFRGFRSPLTPRVFVGATLFAFGITLSAVWFRSLGVDEFTVPTPILIAIVLCVVGVTIPARELRRAPRRSSLLQQVAREELERLQYHREESGTESATFKGLSLLFEATSDRSVTRSERDSNRHDLVSRLESLLRLAVSESDRYDRAVIAIDELDKLSDPSDAVDIINHLKDLFHIRGVHFIVSVSTEALDSFASRGVPARDAFDSAFDDVIHMSRLTVDESIALLKSRSTGFPTSLALFCHTWAGGLARDVIRAGRECLDQFRRHQGQQPTTADVIQAVMLRGLTAAVQGSLRLAGEHLDPSTARNLEAVRIALDEHHWDIAACQIGSSSDLPEVVRWSLSDYLHTVARIWAEFALLPRTAAWRPSDEDFQNARTLAHAMAAVGMDRWERWGQDGLQPTCSTCRGVRQSGGARTSGTDASLP
ncbi:P-loop NTPase fold protein [Promicromonospora sp. NFX87]|uniref:P-loop NTPase fold protein n=1 Tax=Promicromonospora sp. NFX87 TaxID=3402691 RepID=UPI003AFB7966